MSVIKNDANNISVNTKQSAANYVIPAVIRDDSGEFSFEKAVILSVILHILFFSSVLVLNFVLKFLGINLDLFKKPDLKPKDIEFVLVEKEAPPINKNTKNRADINSRAGGINDPKRPVSMPQTSAPKTPKAKPESPAPKKAETVKPQKTQQAAPKVQKPQKTQPAKTAPQPQAPKTAPKPSAPKPSASAATPRPTVKPSSKFNIPIPKSAIPNIQPSSSPVTSAPKSNGGSGYGRGKSGGTAAPSFSPTTSGHGAGGTGKGQGGGGRFSNGTGSGYGNAGNPGPGNPKGAPGIDAIREPDFGPYMKELQRRIKMNWDPPKGDQSKRVVLLFSIARDGRLLNVSVHRSSGLPMADKAAIDAVKLTAPFRPLPAEFKGNSVDIQFTFDYNVFGVSG